jgi:uncharacterized protein YceK
MKRIIAFIMAMVLTLCLAGCGSTQKAGKETEPNNQQGNVNTSTSTEATETDVTQDTTQDSSEVPGAEVHVVDIWDRTKEEQLVCADAEEKFWEDETNEYYFSCIKSQYIMVMDSTGRTIDVVTALENGLITIETLDDYGIGYHTEPKK